MEETEQLVKEEIEKLFLAFSSNFFCFFGDKNRTEEGDKLELAKHLQTCFRKEYDGGRINLHNEIYSYHQTEIIKKLERILPEQETVSNYSQNKISEDECEDWFENPYKKPVSEKKSINKTIIKTPKKCNNTQEISLELMHTNFESNVRFIEKILTVCDEIERKSPYFPTILHEVLFDEAEHVSQLAHSKITDPVKKDQLSEDSGFYSENVLEESSGNIRTTEPAVVVNDTLRSTNTNSVVVDSLAYILESIKTEIDSNTKEVVQNWKESLVEHACSLVCRCSLKGAEYEKTVQNFIVDLLQDIWSDRQMNQHTKWSQQISIISKLLTTPPICLEVLFFITEVLDNVTTAIRKGCCTSFMIVKVALFLGLYPITAKTLNVLLKPFYEKPLQKSINVTKLWQEKFSSVTSDNYHEDVIQGIKTDIIPKLIGFLTITINREPLISLVAKEALEELNNLGSESYSSQDSLKDMY